MRVSLLQLEALLWVARLGGVQEAANHLNLTQPTVSLRLRDLASALDRKIFERDGRRMRLTVDGEAILQHANIIVDEVEKIYGRGRPSQASGQIRVGVSEAIALAGLPSILDNLSQEHPLLRLDLSIGTSVDLERDLLAGAIDIAFGINLDPDPRLRVVPLGVQEATWVARADMRLPPRIRPADIVHLPILTNPSPSPMFRQTVRWFHAAGLEPRQISISNTTTVIAHLVAAGVGLAILPSRLVEEDVRSGVLVALRSRPSIETSHMGVAYRIADRRPAIAAVMKATQDVLEQLNWLKPI